MKKSYRENLASSSGLEPYAGDGDIVGVASVRGDAGQPSSSEIRTFACRPCTDRGKARSDAPIIFGVSQHFCSLAQEYPVQSRLVCLLRLVVVD